MKQYFTKTKKELEDILKKEIDEVADGVTGIQCGHFPLIQDEKNNRVIPAIFEDIKDSEIKESVKSQPYMGYFPLTTWKYGISLVKYAEAKGKNPKIVIAVNDWQWVKKAKDGEENPWKEKFYKDEILPKSYFEELKKEKIGLDLIMPFRNQEGNVQNKFFFSEQRLRNRFKRYYAATCPLNNECAQEYVPLLTQLQKEGFRCLISFIPKTCELPINAGSENFKNNLGGENIKIINIFASGIFKNDFWEDISISIYN